VKHFVDIEALREFDVDLGGGAVRPSNCSMFEPGDIIQITEKIDGCNCSVQYNAETKQLDAFSRKRELDFKNTNRGFWNFVQTLNPESFAEFHNFVFFGEWLVRHTIKYNDDRYNHWYVYDIYDVEKELYLPQSAVVELCAKLNLEYVHTLYYGEFISWDHVRTFLHSPIYGERQEGVVVKNQSKLDKAEDSRTPSYIKIVNEEFKESKVTVSDELKKEKKEALDAIETLLLSVVTEARVKKEILKMVDDGILPEQITPQDMRIVAQNLPKRIYEDCAKEEPEIIEKAGEYAGKVCSTLAMRFAKKIIIG